MKKTAIASAIALSLGLSAAAEANTAGLTGVWSGTYSFTMFSPGGNLVGSFPDNGSWTWDFDAGTVSITNTSTFYGSVWTAYSVTFSDTGTSYDGSMLFSWSANPQIPVDVSWDVTATGNAVGDTAIVSVNSSQITASASAFPNFQPYFSGDLTKVPVPAAVWLMGSGLIGLVGVARRRRRS